MKTGTGTCPFGDGELKASDVQRPICEEEVLVWYRRVREQWTRIGAGLIQSSDGIDVLELPNRIVRDSGNTETSRATTCLEGIPNTNPTSTQRGELANGDNGLRTILGEPTIPRSVRACRAQNIVDVIETGLVAGR